jgi:hypothetical protein
MPPTATPPRPLLLAFALALLAPAASAQTISEFQPNPPGSDPSTTDVELKGAPGTPFSGTLLSIEDDGANGRIDRLADVSGAFDADGLLVATIPDLENPSFTFVLATGTTASIGDDIDTDDDGTADNTGGLGTVLDAIGIADDGSEALYAGQLGGTDFAFTGTEPELVFRDGQTGDLFAVNDLTDGGSVFDVNGDNVPASEFNQDPTQPTFGAPNPTQAALAVACATDAPLSFDFDGDEDGTAPGGGVVAADDFDALGTDGTFGEFAAVRNESASTPVDLAGCAFVVFDPFDEEVTYADNVTSETVVAADDSLVFATQNGDRALPATTLPDGPGAFALVTGTAQQGDDVLVFAPVNGQTRVVAAVVYDENRNVFGSVQGGATQAQMSAFLEAMAEAFGQATSAEDGAEAALSVTVWPNPSAGRARVAFGLAEAGPLHVAVYDVLGREVAVLAEGLHGPGRHTAALDAGALAPGAYVVRVASEAGVRTARLTVAR